MTLLAVELGDKLVEPVMDWDRVGTEGRAQFAVVAPVVAQAVSGSIHGGSSLESNATITFVHTDARAGVSAVGA